MQICCLPTTLVECVKMNHLVPVLGLAIQQKLNFNQLVKTRTFENICEFIVLGIIPKKMCSSKWSLKLVLINL